MQEYHDGRLRAFADEEKRFVPLELALTLKPAYQEADTEPTDDIDAIFHEQNGRFVLIGDPGAGKSTTLRHLMRQAIAQYRQDPIANRLPVWINLGEGANPVQLDELIDFWWNKRCFLPGTPEQYIRQHNLLLFLDGLNEMPLDSRSERAEALRTFLEQNREVQAVVCCRVWDYEDDEKLNLSLPVVRVLPLDDGRVQDFLVRNGGESGLWDTIRTDDALRALAANPYNLYQLIKVSAERGGQELPRDLNHLYRRYLKVTYDRYTVEREKQRDKEIPLLKLPLNKLEKRLQRLAFAMLAEGKGTSADLEWALHWRRRWRWGQQAIKDGINLGVLIGDGDSIRFYHQSLHGYFAIEPLNKALNIGGGFERFTKNPIALIRQIGDLGAAGAPAVEALNNAMRIGDEDVRRSAAKSMGKIGIPAVESLISALMTYGDEDVRCSAIEVLGQIGDRRAVEPLINALTDNNGDVRRSAIEVLGQIGDRRAVEPLINALRDSKWYVRGVAAKALAQIGDRRAIGDLINSLDDGDSLVREYVASALGILGDMKAVEPLIKTLHDKDFRVRLQSFDGLGKLGDARAIEPLIKALSDEELDIRRAAVIALSRIGDTAVEPLINLLEDTAWWVIYVIETLGDLGDKRAVEPLLHILQDLKSGNRRTGAAQALGKIRDQRAIVPLINALGGNDSNVRCTAAEALGQIGDRRAVKPLINVLVDSNEHVRSSAARALSEIGTFEAFAAIAKYRRENPY